MTEEQRQKAREKERRRYYRNKALGIERMTPEQKEAKRAMERAKYREKHGDVREYTSNDAAKRTLREVGAIMGMSPTMVMNVEHEALQKFCERLEAACEDMREEFYARLESDRTGNSGGVPRILPRPELGLIA